MLKKKTSKALVNIIFQILEFYNLVLHLDIKATEY